MNDALPDLRAREAELNQQPDFATAEAITRDHEARWPGHENAGGVWATEAVLDQGTLDRVRSKLYAAYVAGEETATIDGIDFWWHSFVDPPLTT